MILPGMTFASGIVSQGTIAEITKGGTISGNDATFAVTALDWYAADTSVGRYQDGWWVCVKIIAPDSVKDSNVNNVNYSNDGTNNLVKNFGTNNDGKTEDGNYYMGCWLPITPEYLENALSSNSILKLTYKFDWIGDGSVDQTFTITVDPSNVTLNKDNSVWCKTVNGIMVVKNGQEIQTHSHSYGAGWEYDKVNHWHECTCRDKTEVAPHTMKWVIDKRATSTEKGSKHEECSVCDYRGAAVELPVTENIADPIIPQTGDTSNVGLWISLLTLSVVGLSMMKLYSKKGKYER